MAQWIKDTKNSIESLKYGGYFDNWGINKTKHIIFHIYPNLSVPAKWIQEREDIYIKNAGLFKIENIPEVNFYVYPSIDATKEIGIVPAVSFPKQKEIHGHLKQSPGHELTHILLGSINPPENFSANSLWAEGICVYFDGTKTDRKKHTNSINYSEEAINTSWDLWKMNLPGDLYPLAGSIVQYCLEKYGMELLLNFIKEIKNSGDNEEELCKKYFRASYDQFQKDWRNWLIK